MDVSKVGDVDMRIHLARSDDLDVSLFQKVHRLLVEVDSPRQLVLEHDAFVCFPGMSTRFGRVMEGGCHMRDFTAKRLFKSYSMHLDGTPEKVFPLLCPVREYDWIEPWRCDMVYTDSGYAELDCVFKTSFPDDGPEDVWVVSHYEPSRRIQFVRVNGIRAERYDITLHRNEDGTTTAIWEQTMTALTAEGNALLEGLSDAQHTGEKQVLERMLNHYLGTGEMMLFDPELLKALGDEA